VKSKEYTVNGTLQADDSEALEVLIDTMIIACQEANQIFKIKRRD
jgi:hypothetical protein